MSLSFYQDPAFTTLLPQYPVHVPVGTTVYVKVTSTIQDTSVKMYVTGCYAKPDENAPDHTKYYLIRDG